MFWRLQEIRFVWLHHAEIGHLEVTVPVPSWDIHHGFHGNAKQPFVGFAVSILAESMATAMCQTVPSGNLT